MSSTDTSTCYHHVVSSTDTSACYHHHVSSIDTSACYHELVSSLDTSTSFEFDRHIDMLSSSSCEFVSVRQTHRIARMSAMSMWETTFPRSSHAGLGRDFTNMFHTREYVSFVKCLPNPAWLLLGNVVSHMGQHAIFFCNDFAR